MANSTKLVESTDILSNKDNIVVPDFYGKFFYLKF